MCEANAYRIKDGGEDLIMESVDIVEPEGLIPAVGGYIR